MIVNGCWRITLEFKPEIIADRVVIADSFFCRLKGLLGRDGLEKGEGLLISPCSSIHCFGMKFAIDAIFLDNDYRVVAVYPEMKPGAMASDRKARYVLELRAGEAVRHRIQIGEQLVITAEQNLERGSYDEEWLE